MKIADFQSQLKSMLGEVDLISFDLFDTLVHRTVLDPADIFEMLHRQLDLPFDFRELRQDAHNRARAKFQPDIKNHEATIGDIFAELERYNLDQAYGISASEIMYQELSLEQTCIVPNNFMISILKNCLSLGKRIIITTDTYLDREFIDNLLLRSGISGHEKIFISSEIGISKHDGSIWPSLCDQIGIASKRILHIGDNAIADVERPAQYGIRTCHYKSALETALENAAFRNLHDLYSDLERQQIGISQFLKATAIHFFSSRPVKDPDPYLWFGFTHAGIVIILFTHWLQERATEDNIDRLLFLARDGYFLHDMYQSLYPAADSGVASVYTYASRRAFRIASLEKLDEQSLASLSETHLPQSIRFYIERIGLNAEQYETQVRELGFDGIEAIVTADKMGMLQSLLEALAPDILTRSAEEREALKTYLDGLHALKSERLGLVDIGWHGSIQKAYERMAQGSWNINQTVKGYYLGLREPSAVFDRIGTLDSMTGFLCNIGIPRGNLDLVGEGASLLEFILYAPHGTTLYFRKTGDGSAEPVLDNAEIIFNVSASQMIQEGMRQLTHHIGASNEFRGFAETEPFLRPIRRVIHSPTLWEARNFGQFKLSSEFGQYVSLQSLAEPSGLIDTLRHPVRALEGYRNSNWKAGYLRQVPAGNWLKAQSEKRSIISLSFRIARRLRRLCHKMLKRGG